MAPPTIPGGKMLPVGGVGFSGVGGARPLDIASGSVGEALDME